MMNEFMPAGIITERLVFENKNKQQQISPLCKTSYCLRIY